MSTQDIYENLTAYRDSVLAASAATQGVKALADAGIVWDDRRDGIPALVFDPLLPGINGHGRTDSARGSSTWTTS